jgi:hypothetical protein
MEERIYSYLMHHAAELGTRILETFPPLQNMTDEIPSEMGTLLRKPLPARAIAIAGLGKHLKTAGRRASWPNAGREKRLCHLVSRTS